MSFISAKIEHYKSIKRCTLDVNDLNLLIGANGSGKTCILESIEYFYRNLTQDNTDNYVFDDNNHFNNYVEITLTFNLSKVVQIAKSKTNNFFDDIDSEKSKYHNFYLKIIALSKKTKENIISVKLTQVKGKRIEWDKTYETRFIIKTLFPFFYINCRNLDINEWSKIWDVLGELSKVSNFDRDSIEKAIKDILKHSDIFSKKIEKIEEIFKKSELTIRKSTQKEFARNLTKIYLSGENVFQNGKVLKYYSTGTNSVKYIELLLRAINELALNKLKEPVVLFDEPEINLHPNYIDELSETIESVHANLKIIVSTHSPRLVKNLLSHIDSINLFNVKMDKYYTNISKMKKYTTYSKTSKYRVEDDHINSYFSKGILFVEGETEQELFSNPYLKILFPKFKDIDVFKAMSQKPILNIMNPQSVNSKIPFLLLVDADKVISYNSINNEFLLKKEYITYGNQKKEFFRFRNKHELYNSIHNLRIRLNNMEHKLKVHYYKPFYSCADDNFREFISEIQNYLGYYNVFMLKTTIEGALINENTYDLALEFLKEHAKPEYYAEFIKYIDVKMHLDRINIMRLVFNGKTDLLMQYNKEFKTTLVGSEAVLLDKMMIGKKTSGWVSKYLDGYFCSLLPQNVEKSLRGMKLYLENYPEEKQTFQKEFAKSFSEIYKLIIRLSNMID